MEILTSALFAGSLLMLSPQTNFQNLVLLSWVSPSKMPMSEWFRVCNIYGITDFTGLGWRFVS